MRKSIVLGNKEDVASSAKKKKVKMENDITTTVTTNKKHVITYNHPVMEQWNQ